MEHLKIPVIRRVLLLVHSTALPRRKRPGDGLMRYREEPGYNISRVYRGGRVCWYAGFVGPLSLWAVVASIPDMIDAFRSMAICCLSCLLGRGGWLPTDKAKERQLVEYEKCPSMKRDWGALATASHGPILDKAHCCAEQTRSRLLIRQAG